MQAFICFCVDFVFPFYNRAQCNLLMTAPISVSLSHLKDVFEILKKMFLKVNSSGYDRRLSQVSIWFSLRAWPVFGKPTHKNSLSLTFSATGIPKHNIFEHQDWKKRVEMINISQNSYQLQRHFSQERPTLLRAEIKCPNASKIKREVCREREILTMPLFSAVLGHLAL